MNQSGHLYLWKASNYDVHQIWPSWKPVSKYILKTVIAFVPKNRWIRDTCESELHTVRINQITLAYGEKKKERPNFCGIFLQNLLISTDFTATIKVTLPLCNGIGVRPLPGLRTCCEQNTSHCLDRLTSLAITRTNTTTFLIMETFILTFICLIQRGSQKAALKSNTR